MNMQKQPRLVTKQLSDVERDSLGGALEPLVYPWRSDDYEDFISAAHDRVRQNLPTDICRALEILPISPQPAGAVVLRNLPTDAILPSTPADGLRALHKCSHISESLNVGVAAILGEPYAFEVEKGSLVHDVAPVKAASNELTNRGTVTLGLHTELAAFAQRPRWLLLLGLRVDHERRAVTPVADIRDALVLLDPRTVSELQKLQFRSRVPFNFNEMFEEKDRFSEPHAVLLGSLDSPELRGALYGGITRGLTPAAADALLELERVMQLVSRPVLLEPGVMAILSNHIVAHGRSAYTPRYDGTDRWFQRLNVADSLWSLRQWQNKSLRVLR